MYYNSFDYAERITRQKPHSEIMIYFTGDTHGDQERLSKKALSKLQPKDTLIICGDFGFIWDNSAKEQKFLDKLEHFRFNICFLDGTHENFDLLYSYPLTKFCGGKAHRIRTNVFHLMRGQIYIIEDQSIFVLGGGELPESMLQDEILPDTARPEVPSREEMLEAVENLEQFEYHLNFIATHEPPAKIRDFISYSELHKQEMSALGAFLDELSKTAKFDKWFFGSMHTDKYISRSYTSVFRALVPASADEI